MDTTLAREASALYALPDAECSQARNAHVPWALLPTGTVVSLAIVFDEGFDVGRCNGVSGLVRMKLRRRRA